MDVVLGLLALLIGIGLATRGYLAMRIVIPIWGAFQGFLLGAGLVAANTGDGFLEGVAAWIVGLVVAVVFGLLAYAYFVAAVVLTFALMGFVLGSGLVVALGIEWNWVAILVGVLVGALLGVAALATRLPMLILAVVTAGAGAATVVGGLMLLFDVVDSSEIGQGGVVDQIEASGWWWLAYVGVFVVGLVAQLRTEVLRTATLAAMWDGERTAPRR